MKYFYDTEFNEDGHTIDLISMGMVAEDGREFYRVSNEFNASRCNPFVVEHVLPQLPPRAAWVSRDRLSKLLLDFIQEGHEQPELWADYCAYDHVALAQLWGPMIDLPSPLPMWTNDLRQLWQHHGSPELPEQPSDGHDALADARWVKHRYELLTNG